MARPHVVFIPGLQCTADLFRDQLAHLSEGFDCRVADTTSDETIEAMAERLLAAAPERFSLVGLSMGGYVAFETLARATGRVERLVLIDTSARADREEQKSARRQIMAIAERDGPRAAVDAVYDRIVAPGNQNDGVLRARIDAMADEIGLQTYLNQQTAIMERRDVREELVRVRTPTLIVVGEEDALTPPKLSEEMRELIPNARLEHVPRCGHMATMEQPAIVNGLLERFLSAQLDAGPKT